MRIPADVERPDRLLAGLTARQLAIVAVAALVLWAGYVATRRLVPFPVFVVAGAPVALVTATLVLGRRDGIGLDRFVMMALRQARAPRRLVPAPEGVRAVPAWSTLVDGAPPPAPMPLPVRAVGADGVVDLGGDGAALVCRASTISLTLRTPAEQEALVGAFGRYLNGTGSPVQVVVRAEPVDLGGSVAELRRVAGGLPHPTLERAAIAHAEFLATLAARADLLGRQVLVVLRDQAGEGAGERLSRRAADAGAALGSAGVTLRVLAGPEVAACLSAALDPFDTLRPESAPGPDVAATGAGR
ncbi:MAG: PrgI family protein [Acidimicrobiales bacterium]